MAIDYCESAEKKGENVYRVIGCTKTLPKKRGLLRKDVPLYIELTKRNRRARVCKNKNGCKKKKKKIFIFLFFIFYFLFFFLKKKAVLM